MMDGDAATPILNFTDKKGKQRNINRKMLILRNDRNKDTGGSTKVERVTLLIMMKKLGAAVTIATVIMIAPLGLPALREAILST